VWLGVLTGFFELVIAGFRVYFLGEPIRGLPELMWMVPVADVALLSLPGLVLAFAAWLWPRVGSLRIVSFAFFTVAFLCLIYGISGLAGYARLLLAFGLGTQASLILARRPRLLRRMIEWTTGWTRLISARRRPQAGLPELAACDDLLNRRQMLTGSTAAVAGLAATVHGWCWLRERQALAALPSADPDMPNIVLLVLDTVRAQSLSLHGYHRSTSPNLDRLARRGVFFRQAVAPSPWTLPSHATMFTGRRLKETGVDFTTPYCAWYPTLAEAMSSQGYQTAAFVGNTFFLCPGFGLHRGFAHYECYRLCPGQILKASALGKGINNHPQIREFLGYYQDLGRKTAGGLGEDLLDWLDARPAGRPFFAFVNYFDAHPPYIPDAAATGRFAARSPRDPRIDSYRSYPSEELDALRDAYDECIWGLDDQLGRLMVRLEERGHLDDTIVIITSDHGEHFGEHDLVGHCHSLYAPLLHVPLLILHPTRACGGEVIPQQVSLRDLPATILDLVGLGQQQELPGASLARLWKSGRAARAEMDVPALSEVTPPPYGVPRRYPVSRGPMQSLVWRDHHYIRNGDGVEELYRTAEDPDEEHNLVGVAGCQAVLRHLRAALNANHLA
jgi:arylsulfatase A-like enzyme